MESKLQSLITQASRDTDALHTNQKPDVTRDEDNANYDSFNASQSYNDEGDDGDHMNDVASEELNDEDPHTSLAGNSAQFQKSKSRGRRPFKVRRWLKSLMCCFSTCNCKGTVRDATKIPDVPNGSPLVPVRESKVLLPPPLPENKTKICLVVDLDETLVHSSFKPVAEADFTIPVEIDGTLHQVYVVKRPYVDEFLDAIGDKFECVLFTASLAKYADPVSDLLDKRGIFTARLFRESCLYYNGNYVKDLSQLGRDISRIVIIDNSPASYVFHPDNAVPVSSWFDDNTDTELIDILPLLDRLAKVPNVYKVLREEQSTCGDENQQPRPPSLTVLQPEQRQQLTVASEP